MVMPATIANAMAIVWLPGRRSSWILSVRTRFLSVKTPGTVRSLELEHRGKDDP